MILALEGNRRAEHPDLFQQMFRLRAKAFGERRNWSVVVDEGLETDAFDNLVPTYLMCVEKGGRLLASLRLLRTTGPHMLADVFTEVADGAVIRDPLVWESTRFCVDTEAAREHTAGGVNMVTAELLTGLFELAVRLGLRNIVSVYDLYLERILRRSGCIFERYGRTFVYDELATVAGLFEVSPRSVASIRARTVPTPAATAGVGASGGP